jgi:hypothetical protein
MSKFTLETITTTSYVVKTSGKKEYRPFNDEKLALNLNLKNYGKKIIYQQQSNKW